MSSASRNIEGTFERLNAMSESLSPEELNRVFELIGKLGPAKTDLDRVLTKQYPVSEAEAVIIVTNAFRLRGVDLTGLELRAFLDEYRVLSFDIIAYDTI